MKKQIIKLTYDELDILTDAMLIMRRQYPLSWNDNNENTFRKIVNAWNEAYETERSNNGEKESWSKKSTTTERTV